MPAFVPRFSTPSNTDLHWINENYGGYNRCILGSPSYGYGSVLSNCTGYAWGRFMEECGLTTCNLSVNQASIWYYAISDGYQRGSTPKLGAVICYDEINSGSGHVAIVEQINYDSNNNVYSLILSESVYNGVTFRLQTVYASNNYHLYTGMSFQGFIYPPVDFDPPSPTLTLEELVCLIKKRRRYY